MPKTHITIPIFIPHSGCPNRCIFCNQWRSSGAAGLPDRESISRQVNSYLTTKPPSVRHIEIAFFGGNFTGIPSLQQEELLATALEFKISGMVNEIRLSTRPDYIDSSTIQRLKKYSVDTVEMGIQSFNEHVLTAARRGHGVAESMEAIGLLSNGRIKYVIQLMAGLPGSTEEDEILSAETAARLRPSGVRLFPTVVLRDTGLEDLYHSQHYIPLSIEDAVERCKKMLEVFIRDGIPVIRIGLHPLKPEEIPSIVAGPYHPSFGYLVKSRLRRDEMEKAIKKALEGHQGDPPEILLPFRNREEYLGPGGENLRYLEKKFHPVRIRWNREQKNAPSNIS